MGTKITDRSMDIRQSTIEIRYLPTSFYSCAIPGELNLRAHDIPQLIKVLVGEKGVIPVTSLHILFDSMEIQGETLH